MLFSGEKILSEVKTSCHCFKRIIDLICIMQFLATLQLKDDRFYRSIGTDVADAIVGLAPIDTCNATDVTRLSLVSTKLYKFSDKTLC